MNEISGISGSEALAAENNTSARATGRALINESLAEHAKAENGGVSPMSSTSLSPLAQKFLSHSSSNNDPSLTDAGGEDAGAGAVGGGGGGD